MSREAVSDEGRMESESPSSQPPGEKPARLVADSSFHAFVATQFLGAFNDNLYKQFVLLLFVKVPTADGGTTDLQWLALALFSLPFILFSGLGGFLSDRHRKWSVILACKIAEVAIMCGAVFLFSRYSAVGLTPLVVAGLSALLFLMGTHSAFFGPSKYGALPEFFSLRNLPAVNGIVLMTTFLAIIFGSVVPGLVLDQWRDRLGYAGFMCVAVAVTGVGTALLLRRLPARSPGLPFSWDMLVVPRDMWQLLRQDAPLRRALTASTIFWLAAAIVQPSVNALGKLQLEQNNSRTSLLVMIISVGIAIGSVVAGTVGGTRFRSYVPRAGAWGMVITLLAMAMPWGPQQHSLGYTGSLVMLCLLGVATGLFAVPLNVFLQSRPPDGLKGRTIATQNLLNWVGIFVAAGLYEVGRLVLDASGWPGNGLFAFTALLMAPIALRYRTGE